MKNFFLLFFLTIISLTSTAQYRKMPLDTNHYWLQSCYVTITPGPFWNCSYQLRVKKDSVVNSKTYQYVKSPVVSNLCNSESALLRQDTIQKLVLILFNNQEKIFYNFNKNVGDTALLFQYGSMVTNTLQTKDSILLSDGFYHKRFQFWSNLGSIIHIEGIGSTYGLLSPWSPFETLRNITCVNKINPTLTNIYSQYGVGGSCPVLTNIISHGLLKNALNIFPNPTSETLNIKTANLIPKSIEIKNILGQTIFFANNILQDITTINIKDFSQGIYFITIDLADKNVTGHFIKN